MRALAPSPLVLLLALSWAGGCSWVTEGDLDCQLLLVDDDQDGFPRYRVRDGHDGPDRCDHLEPVDCDDSNPDINPGAEEIWYDGVDQDCAGDDDYDHDKDGFVPAAYEGLATAGVPGSGQLPGGDCDDDDPEVNPGMEDPWYDGVDQDCAGNDDYDQDRDGFVPSEYEGFETMYVEGSGQLPGGDCDDEDPSVNPGALDPWYDGVDQDCAGNDDYDQDRDGFVPSEYEGLETMYVEGSGQLPGGDCDDTNPRAYPDAREVWYDGVDQDCAGDDDYDQDKDGFVPSEYEGLATRDVEGSGELPGGDCDDTDPTIHPHAVEAVADGVDQDCDGGDDTFWLDDVPEFTWSGILELTFAENSTDVFLGVSALAAVRALSSSSSSYYFDSTLALAFPASAPGASFTDLLPLLRYVSDPTVTLTSGLDLLATDDHIYGVTGTVGATTRQLVLRGYDLGSSSSYGANPPVTESITFDDTTVAMDDYGNVHAVGCVDVDSTVATSYVWATPDNLVASRYDDTFSREIRARSCSLDFLDLDGLATLLVAEVDDTTEEAALVAYTFEPCGTSTVCNPTLGERYRGDGLDVLALDAHSDGADRLLTVADASGPAIHVLSMDSSFSVTALLEIELDSGDPLLQLSTSLGTDGTMYMATLTESGQITLHRALLDTGAVVSTDFYTDHPAFDVALHAGDGWLYVAAAMTDGLEERLVMGVAAL